MKPFNPYTFGNPAAMGRGAASPLLDTLAGSPVAAYSNRKLRAAYAGAAIRVINTDTSTQTDLAPGFTKAQVDALGAVSKIGIVKIYDQSGNGKDLTFAGGQRAILDYLCTPVWDWSDMPVFTSGAYQTAATVTLGSTCTQFFGVDCRQGSLTLSSFVPTPGTYNFVTQISGSYVQYGVFNTNAVTYNLPTDESSANVTRGMSQVSSYFQTGNETVRRNGVALGVASGTDTGGNGGANGVLSLGDVAAAGIAFKGRMNEWIVFDGTPSTADRDIIEASQIAYGQLGKRFVMHGDSLGYGIGLAGSVEDFSVGAVVRDTLGDGWDFYNRALPSSSFNSANPNLNTITNAPGKVDPLRLASAQKNILAIWTGFNDMQVENVLYTSAIFLTNLATYCAARRAAGWKIILCTIPEADYATQGASYKTKKTAANDWIVANGLTIADAVANMRADTHIGDGANTSDTTYYDADKLHMKEAGYALAAGYIATAVATL